MRAGFSLSILRNFFYCGFGPIGAPLSSVGSDVPGCVTFSNIVSPFRFLPCLLQARLAARKQLSANLVGVIYWGFPDGGNLVPSPAPLPKPNVIKTFPRFLQFGRNRWPGPIDQSQALHFDIVTMLGQFSISPRGLRGSYFSLDDASNVAEEGETNRFIERLQPSRRAPKLTDWR